MNLKGLFSKLGQFRHLYPIKKEGANLDKKLVFSRHQYRMPNASQWKKLPQLLSKNERTWFRVLLIILVVSVIAWGGSLIARHVTFVPKVGGTWREGMVGTPRFINPILATSDTDRDIARLVYSGLLRMGSNGRLVPDLAESMTISSDNKVYTIKLRKGLKFHDGEPLVAEDVVFTFEAIQNEVWRSPLWKSFKNVSIASPDDSTLVLTLSEPFTPFINVLLTGILPKHIWEDVDPANARYAVWNIKPIGSGPFKFKSTTRNQTGEIRGMSLVAYDHDPIQRPFVNQMDLQFYGDLVTAINNVREGQIDGLFTATSEEVIKDIPKQRFTIMHLKAPSVTTLFFNGRDATLTKNVREALSLALDRKTVLTALGDAEEAFGPVAQTMGSENTFNTPYEFDPKSAQVTLNKALRDKKLEEIKLIALDDPTSRAVSHEVVRSWRLVGMPVREVLLSVKDFRDAVRNRAFSVLLWTTLTPYDPDPFPFWHTSQIESPGLNVSAWRSRSADVLLEEARTASDQSKRNSKYEEFQTMIRKEIPAIFLASPRVYYITAKKAHGISFTAINLPADRFSNVREWYLKKQSSWK